MILLSPIPGSSWSNQYLDLPYRDGWNHVTGAFASIQTLISQQRRHVSSEPSSTLCARTVRFLFGILLLVPIVNIIVHIAYRYFTQKETVHVQQEAVRPPVVPHEDPKHEIHHRLIKAEKHACQYVSACTIGERISMNELIQNMTESELSNAEFRLHLPFVKGNLLYHADVSVKGNFIHQVISSINHLPGGAILGGLIERHFEVMEDLINLGCDPNQEAQSEPMEGAVALLERGESSNSGSQIIPKETALSFFVQNYRDLSREIYLYGIKILAKRLIPCIAEKITSDPTLIVLEYL